MKWNLCLELKPKHGKRVLILVHKGGNYWRPSCQKILVATYFEPYKAWASEEMDLEYAEPQPNWKYDEERDDYLLPECWFEANEYDKINWQVEDPVIAWMPLPSLEPLYAMLPAHKE